MGPSKIRLAPLIGIYPAILASLGPSEIQLEAPLAKHELAGMWGA